MATTFDFDPSVSDAPLDAADHEFTVAAVIPKTSRSGNPMLEVTLKTTTFKGEVSIKDWLVALPGGMWKLRQFCEATGQPYTGSINLGAVVGRRVVGTVVVEKDDKGQDRSSVKGYAEPAGGVSNVGQVRKDAQKEISKDDIPF